MSQQKIHKPYMPREIQRLAVWYVKLYPRYVLLEEQIRQSSKSLSDLTLRGGPLSDPTGNKAAALEEIVRVIKAIEDARAAVPDFYQRGVWNNILFSSPYPRGASVYTWRRYKNDFLFNVAVNLELMF